MIYKDDKKEYNNISYKELNHSINNVAASIKNLGIKKGDRVAIFSYNRPEWVITDLAVMKLGGIVVPIYHTLSLSTIIHIISDSGSKLIFVENEEYFDKINSIRSEIPSITDVVVFDAKKVDKKKKFLNFRDLTKEKTSIRENIRSGFTNVSPNDIATIVYTSGTTGNPKGVMLSHHNILSNAFSIIRKSGFASEDVSLSYLPLSHMFERTCGYYTILFAGGSIGFAEDFSTVPEDIRKINPTILLAVPRVTEKAYEAAVEQVRKSSKIKRAIILLAIRNLNLYANLKYKKKKITFILKIKCYILNKFVASKFRKLAGDRLKVIMSGGAPLNPQVAKVFYILGFNIVEGYGLTETSPVVCTNTLKRNILGTVGKPLDDVEIKIGKNDEILVRGPNVMQGYFNKPEETARVVDKEGWFHTGDKGKFDQNGNLIITGRIKEIIVTSYGKNVTPVPIEAEISKSNYINQVMLYGDGEKFISALILPEKDSIISYAKKTHILTSDYAELLKKEEIKNLVLYEIEKLTADFAHYEKVKAFVLLAESFTVENGMLTPTLKLRRSKIIEKYRNEIDSIYFESHGR